MCSKGSKHLYLNISSPLSFLNVSYILIKQNKYTFSNHPQRILLRRKDKHILKKSESFVERIQGIAWKRCDCLA